MKRLSVILTLKVVLINTFNEKSNNLSPCCFSMVADHLALGCHGNVNLEPNISLFLALIDLIEIFLNLYILLRCAFVESR